MLDPALDPNEPLLVNEWYNLMNDQNLKVAVCSTYTYYTNDSCLNPTPGAARDKGVMDDVKFAITLEQDNFSSMFLGDKAPWQWKNAKTFGKK